MTTILILFAVLSGLLILVSLFLAGRVQRPFRHWFLWAPVFFLWAFVPVMIGLLTGRGDVGARADHSAVPFLVFCMLFFVPSGIMIMLIGMYEDRDSRAHPEQYTNRMNRPAARSTSTGNA
ncbi:MAG: hypothetical protein WKH64_19520 [Chloroflexia bacterium]